MIRFDHVSKSYGSSAVLKDVSFSIPDGKFAVLIGPSGCGKTTTLKIINRLISPDSGSVYINDRDIMTVDKVQLRCHIGYVIQQIGLFPNMTVAENISVVPKLLKYSKSQCSEIVDELLKMVNMEKYRDKYPSEMSGGQQQRIGVLRALAASPPIVLMDEPFSALDPMTRLTLQDEIKSIQQKLSKTVVFVTHDMNEALKLADIIIFMNNGGIVQMAGPGEILEKPANELVRSFLGTRSQDNPGSSNVERFMKTRVFCASVDRGVIECAEIMARNNVDSLVIVDGEKKYAGTVTIGDIHRWGRHLKNISSIVRQNVRTAYVGDNAKESFEHLLDDSSGEYVVVLNKDDTVAGIVTKTSVARSVAESLWGDGQ